MDFSFTEDQLALRDLTRQIATDHCTATQLRSIAESDSGTDLALWQKLADAGLVGIAAPESAGGSGLDWIEAAIVLSEVARASAPVPAFATLALALAALDAAPEVQRAVVSGATTIAGAIHEPIGDAFAPHTTFDAGHVTGVKTCVMHGNLASAFVVTTNDGLVLVEADQPGVTVKSQRTSTDAPDAHVIFDNAQAQRLGDQLAQNALLWRGISAAAVMSAAACEEALRLLSEYAVERHQFDKPIASFQAVSQRAAEAYIDTEAVRLTAWQAAWRLSQGLPAERELLIAKFWAAEGGWRAVHGALHIHGGVGVDRDYPLHRHFLLQKQMELHLGSATPSLLALGKRIAVESND